MDLGIYANSLRQKMVVFYILNETPNGLTNMGIHSCYLRVVLRKSDIFPMIFYLLAPNEFGFKKNKIFHDRP